MTSLLSSSRVQIGASEAPRHVKGLTQLQHLPAAFEESLVRHQLSEHRDQACLAAEACQRSPPRLDDGQQHKHLWHKPAAPPHARVVRSPLEHVRSMKDPSGGADHGHLRGFLSRRMVMESIMHLYARPSHHPWNPTCFSSLCSTSTAVAAGMVRGACRSHFL